MLQELLCRLPDTLNKPNQILKLQNVSWVEEGSCSERLLGLNPRVSEMAGLGKRWKPAFLTDFHMMVMLVI